MSEQLLTVPVCLNFVHNISFFGLNRLLFHFFVSRRQFFLPFLLLDHDTAHKPRQKSLLLIVIYECNIFIVQATSHSACEQDVRATFNSASVSKFCAQHFLFWIGPTTISLFCFSKTICFVFLVEAGPGQRPRT
jgi:hypothetical protein